MNLLILTEYFPDSMNGEITGGVESRAFNISKKLSKTHNVKVITSWRKKLKRHEFFEDVEIFRTGNNHKYSNYGGFLSRSLFAYSAYKKGISLKNVDIVHGLNFTSYLPAYLIAKKLDKKCVATYHETWINNWIKNKGIITGVPYELFERLLLKLKYDKIISVSEFTQEKLVKAGIDKERIKVIPNGIDFSYLNKKNVEKFDSPTICYVGRLVKTKNVDVLLKSLVKIKDKFPKIKCKIVGQGPEENYLKDLSKKLEVDSNVEFLGFLPQYEQVIKILGSSHVMCNPSVLEGFGIILLESMALNTPYVCSDISVFKETTHNGRGGLLFKKKNHVDLAKKIMKLLADKNLYKRKQKQGKKLSKKYDWNEVVKQIDSVYEKIKK